MTKCPRDGASDWASAIGEEVVDIAIYGVPKSESQESKQLTPKCRLLHVLLITCVMPRSGSRDHVSKIEKFALYHLVQKTKIDITDPFLDTWKRQSKHRSRLPTLMACL